MVGGVFDGISVDGFWVDYGWLVLGLLLGS